MANRHSRATRILAVDPSTPGFGFALLEGPERLVDWGVRYVPRNTANKNAACLKGTEDLIEWYGPEVLVVEDARHSGCLRRARVRNLFPELRMLAGRMRVAFAPVPTLAVRAICGGSPRATKEAIAMTVAGRFPELFPRLPPHRRPWMSEDVRMAIFDAAALGLTFFQMPLGKPGAARAHPPGCDVAAA